MSYIGRVRPQETTSSVLRSTYTGNGSTTTYALPGPVANETSIIATINGVTQQDAAYTTDGSNIIFAAAPASGDAIELRTLSAVAMSYAPSAGSVVTSTIADLGVTTAKINDLAVTGGKIAAATITQDKLSTNVVGNGPVFHGYTTSNITVSNNSVTNLNFGTKQFDSHNAYSGNTFTAPVSGYYQYNVTVCWSGDITGNWSVAAWRNGASPIPNGAVISTASTYTLWHGLSGSDIIYLAAGDALTWMVYQTTGSTKYVTAGGETFASVVLVRNA